MSAILVALPLSTVTACAPAAPDKYTAQSMCENWVKDTLKAPSTAHFHDETTVGGPNKFTVLGSVDAENSFGAALTSPFTCTTHSSDGETWYRDNVQVGQ